MMEFPSKTITIDGRQYSFFGLSEDDPYFQLLADDFESEFGVICKHILHNDSVCMDIGANIGVKSMIMAAHAPQGIVYSAEAAPSVVKILEMNIESNHHCCPDIS